MAFLEVHGFSGALDVAVTVNVLMPEAKQGVGVQTGGAEELPQVLYLLHGYSDDHTIWMRRTALERYCAQYNLAVIMPAVQHSFYANEKQGERYWDYVSDELPRMMHRMLRLSSRREDTFAAGLSMGGYGAMKLALSFPERFAAAASFSGAVDVEARLRAGDKMPVLGRAMGSAEEFRGSENDLFYLLEKNASAPAKPRLMVACGTADFLYAQHQKFVPALEGAGWDVTHIETPEIGHSWAYWDEMIERFLRFMQEAPKDRKPA